MKVETRNLFHLQLTPSQVIFLILLFYILFIKMMRK